MRPLLREAILKTINEIMGDTCDVLAVFDFDDTLVTSESSVIVTYANGKTEQMTPAEYAVYKPQDGDTFDYSQFDDVVGAKPTAIFKLLSEMLHECGVDSVAILTARSPSAQLAIREFFDEQLGVHLKDIITVGTSDPNAKALQIRKFANLYKPSVIHFYDDSPANIAAVDKIAAAHPDLQDVEVITHHVGESDR